MFFYLITPDAARSACDPAANDALAPL